MKLKIDFDGRGGEPYKDSMIKTANAIYGVDVADVDGLAVIFSGDEKNYGNCSTTFSACMKLN